MPRFVMLVLFLCLLSLGTATADDLSGRSGLGLELGLRTDLAEPGGHPVESSRVLLNFPDHLVKNTPR